MTQANPSVRNCYAQATDDRAQSKEQHTWSSCQKHLLLSSPCGVWGHHLFADPSSCRPRPSRLIGKYTAASTSRKELLMVVFLDAILLLELCCKIKNIIAFCQSTSFKNLSPFGDMQIYKVSMSLISVWTIGHS